MDSNEVDPAAEFLAREQDELAGLEDALATNGTEAPPLTTPLQNDQPLGQESSLRDGLGDFEMVDSNIGQATTELFDPIISGDAEETQESKPVESQKTGSVSPVPPVISQNRPVREEPEKIRVWREEQARRLQEKDAAEEQKKEELRNNAKKELEEWYRHHDEQIAKNKTSNRNAEKDLVMDNEKIEPGQEWERIAKLCDFNPKLSRNSKDTSRMRSIILQLKQSPIVRS